MLLPVRMSLDDSLTEIIPALPYALVFENEIIVLGFAGYGDTNLNHHHRFIPELNCSVPLCNFGAVVFILAHSFQVKFCRSWSLRVIYMKDGSGW